MTAVTDFLKALFDTAREALRQMELAAPDYWDGTVDTAVRVALLALAAFAALLLVRLLVLVFTALFTHQKKLGVILAFAGTLAVVLALCAYVYGPLTETLGEALPVWAAGADSGSAQSAAP